MNATALSRLSNVEARKVVDTVLSLHGQPLERPRQSRRVIARTKDGGPIYAPDADH
jgi:hypothetical protein